MFSFLAEDGSIGLRLPPDALEEFLGAHQTSIAEQHGRQMKEFALVPHALLANVSALAAWFERSYVWIGTRKPKPTKTR